MKIACTTRRLGTPQTNSRTGQVNRDVNDQKVYTEYLKLSAKEEWKLKKHMKLYTGRVIEAMDQVGIDTFAELCDVDLNYRTKINTEPSPHSIMDRLDMVIARIGSSKDLTVGIIDAYNNVMENIYRTQGFSNQCFKDRVCIEIVDPDDDIIQSILNPNLFDE